MKRMILTAVTVLVALAAMAQSKGVASGWKVTTSTDDFTDEKSYRCDYFEGKNPLPSAVYWPRSGAMTIIELFDGSLYFDVTFDAVMDNRGHINDKYIDYDLHIKFPKGEIREDSDHTNMGYMDIKRAGETFAGMFNIVVTLDDLKRGTSIAVRWEDPIKGKTVVKKISLTGFTKCFEECAKRSVQDLIDEQKK